MNWVDFVILISLIYFLYQGAMRGFWHTFIDSASFVAAMVCAYWLYKPLGQILQNNFSIPEVFANPLGFVSLSIGLEILLAHLLFSAIVRLYRKFKIKPIKPVVDKIAGGIFGVGHGLITITFLLILVTSFPLNPLVKETIAESKIAQMIIPQAPSLEAKFDEVFGEAFDQTLLLRVIKPGSEETVSLNFVKTLNLKVDDKAEKELFALVNVEREKENLPKLTWREELLLVARDHARDMWTRKYFSHFSPEGRDVGDRLSAAGVKFVVAGENLALAPNVKVAHEGLMNSEGHRANILEKSFKRMAVGTIDNGYYGKIFVQVFSD